MNIGHGYVGADFMSIMYLDGEELDYIWESICKVQMVFHPRYSINGEIDFNKLLEIKSKKKVCIFLDRNLLSGLLKLCHDGYLKNEKEMRLIALLMAWALINDFPISSGLAIKEKATNYKNLLNAKIELQDFKNIFLYYPSMLWLRLAEGNIDSIPVCKLSQKPYSTELDYTEEGDHFLMHISEMLHVAYLNNRHELSPVEKMLDFLQWNYTNLLLCEATIVYAAMLFTNQAGIRSPKYSGSNNIEKIFTGCKNQAWDLTYLSAWSTFHYHEDEMKDIFLFATSDNLLQTIFINTYAEGGVNALIHSVFSQKDYDKIVDFIMENQGENRKIPYFGTYPQEYFHRLIHDERERIINVLN